jgi:hypothetical protein
MSLHLKQSVCTYIQYIYTNAQTNKHHIWKKSFSISTLSTLHSRSVTPRSSISYCAGTSSVFLAGTDSRVGVGFRLGNHADFQVLLELGPQVNTQPIGPEGDSKTRRQVDRPTHAIRPALSSEIVADTPGGKWLSSWRSVLLNSQSKVRLQDTSKSLGTCTDILLNYPITFIEQPRKTLHS